MDKDYEKLYHILEGKHFWFVARRDIIYRLIKKHVLGVWGNNSPPAILDVGCSGGETIRFLISKGLNNVYGIDISSDAIDKCRRLGIPNVVVGDAVSMPFDNDVFDCVIASDLMEHLDDDMRALREWHRNP